MKVLATAAAGLIVIGCSGPDPGTTAPGRTAASE
ncbi:hypothetical protein JOF29_002572 [Kribbella aluminosa]|uniref:Uncharacterized protein n=1 Tax=Kribbella aluminosa TaxID=416017 RepID=A0ABS4UIX9_9ACTN|nr:hypothetical protein [Kribbella aluminosa]